MKSGSREFFGTRMVLVDGDPWTAKEIEDAINRGADRAEQNPEFMAALDEAARMFQEEK